MLNMACAVCMLQLHCVLGSCVCKDGFAENPAGLCIPQANRSDSTIGTTGKYIPMLITHCQISSTCSGTVR